MSYPYLTDAELADSARAARDANVVRPLSAAIVLSQAEVTKTTGIAHHVDHVVPLQGRFVSGLHVETNLQIITGRDNSRKKNRFEVA